MLHLVTFDGLALESVNEAVPPRLSAQRLAILAVLAAEGDRRVSRERLTGLFWPDVDEERARHSLRQALYTLRQEVGRDVVRSDFVLTLDPSAITSDVREFRSALARGDHAAAGTLVRGPFLAGFYLPAAASFQRWVEEERARLQTAATGAIATLAMDASAANDLDGAIVWWRRLTALDPLSGRFALGYLKALAARGDRAEALDFGRQYAALVRRELEAEPDGDVQRLIAGLRTTPAVRATPAIRVPSADPTPVASVADATSAPTEAPPAPTPYSRTRRLTRAVVVAGALAAGILLARVSLWRPPGSAGASEPPAGDGAAARAGITTTSPTAYRLFEEGLRAYYGVDRPAARQMIRAALDDDSTFAMAAYYDALLTDTPGSFAPTVRALRLADRASERERLIIYTDLVGRVLQAPRAEQIAESLATRYGGNARALEAVGRTRQFVGDWAGAADALGRTLSIDSAAYTPGSPCYLCEDFNALAEVYFWWDSLPAASRVAKQYTRFRPVWPRAWELTFLSAAKMGDTSATREALRQFTRLQPSARNVASEVRVNLLLDQYDNVERDLRTLLESAKPDDFNDARWNLLIALRNQGRLREAWTLNETGRISGVLPPQFSPVAPEVINQGLLALERGDARAAAASFRRLWEASLDGEQPPGLAARYHAWRGTLAGMAVAATGDTAAVRRLADSVEFWGQRSLYGRDRKAHHYLRGLGYVASRRDDDAIREFREAMYSPTLGFTRVNLELGRALLRQGRGREAASAVAPALRGEIDASNLYVTRTELHELLAHAYDQAGVPDSAAAHYRMVVRAWASADEQFRARRDSARRWLARFEAQ